MPLLLDAADRALAEFAIGRTLRRAEAAIDVLGLDAALNEAKDQLEQAIRDEMQRAASAWLIGGAARPIMAVTEEMLDVLNELVELGRQEALLEMERLGYAGVTLPEPGRSYAAEALPGADGDLDGYLRRNIPALGWRIEDELVEVELAGASQTAIAQALLRVPGARDIASRIISTALTNGLGLTFEENADLVLCWEYTAVLDNAACSSCRPLDGKRYETLEALFVDLPGFGPNPRCKGGGRCRCRAVPCDPAEVGQNQPGGLVEEPAVEPEPLTERAVAEGPPPFATTRDAEAWIVERGFAREVSLGTISPESARDLADALTATLGRHGVTINRFELDPTSKRSLARFRHYGPRDAGEIQVKRVVANAKTVATRAAKARAIYEEVRFRAIRDRRRQIGDETRPLPLRERALAELEKVEAATRWTVWEHSSRPAFSIVAHEAAHALEHNLGLGNAWRDALVARDVTLLERFSVSEYGASSSSELFAEAVALRLEGFPMPDSIRAALDDVLPIDAR